MTEENKDTTTPAEQLPEKQKQKAPADSIGHMMERLKPQIARALPKHMTEERLARVALTAIRNSPKLAEADKLSLMGSIITAAQLGLEPNTPLGQCYIIPYWDSRRKGYEAQFQFGYQGLIELARRTGEYQTIYAHAVDAADDFSYSYGLNPDLHHIPADTPSGERIYYYAVYKLTNGGSDFRVWSKDQVLEHAKHYSQSWDAEKGKFRPRSAWDTAFDSMACKTVLIDVLKYAPKSVEIAKAVSSEGRTYRLTDDPDEPVHAVEGEFELQSEGAEA